MENVLGLDLDGVILDHTKRKIEVAREFGINISEEETPSDVLRELVGDGSIYRNIKEAVYSNSGIASFSSVMPGAKEALIFFKKSKAPYFLISRRKNPQIAIETLKTKNLWPTFFNKHNAFFVLEKEHKDLKAQELGINTYLDDELGVLEVLGSVKNRILFDPYNIHENISFEKVFSWHDFLNLYKKISLYK